MQSLHQSFTYKTSSSCHWYSHLVYLQQPKKTQQNLLQGTWLIQHDKLTISNATKKKKKKSFFQANISENLLEQTFWGWAAPQKTLNLLVSHT